MAAAQSEVNGKEGPGCLGNWAEARTWRPCRPQRKHGESNRVVKDLELHPKCNGKPLRSL